MYDIAQGMGTVFVDTKWRSGNEENNCFISSGMGSVFDSLYRELDDLCMQHLKGITLGDVTKEIVLTQLRSQKECHGAITGDCPAWNKNHENKEKSRANG